MVTSTSETAFSESAETVSDFVTNPENSDDDLPRQRAYRQLAQAPAQGRRHLGGAGPGRITVSYRFTRPGRDITLFARTMTIETDKPAPLPDQLFRQINPAKIDAYHEAVARELARSRH